MSEILFYHLTQSTLNEALPSLVERSIARDWKVSLQFTSSEERDAMDSHLWSYSPSSFIPHGSEIDPDRELQPVYLTTGQENPNQSHVRFLINGAYCENTNDYQRLVVMFDGKDLNILDIVRNQWKTYKNQSHTLTYWHQTQNRQWEKKA